jgi:hypothetical protein
MCRAPDGLIISPRLPALQSISGTAAQRAISPPFVDDWTEVILPQRWQMSRTDLLVSLVAGGVADPFLPTTSLAPTSLSSRQGRFGISYQKRNSISSRIYGARAFVIKANADGSTFSITCRTSYSVALMSCASSGFLKKLDI